MKWKPGLGVLHSPARKTDQPVLQPQCLHTLCNHALVWYSLNRQTVNPLKYKDVNWLHFAIQV